MKYRILLIGLVTFSWLCAATAWARQSDVPEAVLALEIDVEQIMASGLSEIAGDGPLSRPELQWLKHGPRISVFASAPSSIEAFTSAESAGGDLPFEALVQIRFKDSSGRESFFETVKNEFEEVTEGGQKLYKPGAGGPPNLRMKLVGDANVEIGTAQYLGASDKKLMTSRLEGVFKDSPKHAIRLGIDMTAMNAIVDEALKGAKEGAPRAVRPFLDLIPKISTVRLSADTKDATILSLSIEANDDAAAEEIFGGLEGLLGMAKVAGAEGAQAIRGQSPTMANVTEEILKSLNSKKTGRNVLLNIPKPEGFDEAIKEVAESAKKTDGNDEQSK